MSVINQENSPAGWLIKPSGWKQSLHGGSLFTGDSSLCQDDIKVTSTIDNTRFEATLGSACIYPGLLMPTRLKQRPRVPSFCPLTLTPYSKHC